MSIYKQDFHIHTYFSDGQASPAEIVKTAKKLGYEKIAITDHDGVDGIEEALAAGEAEDLEVVPGIEMATETSEGIGLHILGHDIDIGNTDLKEALKVMLQKRNDRNRRLIEALNDMGYDIKMDELVKMQPNNFIGKPVMARWLVKEGFAMSVAEVFDSRELFESDAIRVIQKDKFKAIEAVKLIKNAGGHAVLAHPIQTKKIGETGSEEFYKNIEDIIINLKGAGLEGIECLHPDQDHEQSVRFKAIADKHELYVTRGSDFHGKDFTEAKNTAKF